MKLGIVALCLVIVALVFLFEANKLKKTGETDSEPRIKVADNRLGRNGISKEKMNEPIWRKAKRENATMSPGRSKGALLKELRRVFGQAEAARTRKLAERFNENNGSYLYLVDPPSKGEVQTVRAQIADLRGEVAAEDREYFDERMKDEIDSYDPYGEKGRKVLLITVPVDRMNRMGGSILEARDLDELQKKFTSGEPYHVVVRKCWVASFDGKTLERFDQLIVWEPQ